MNVGAIFTCRYHTSMNVLVFGRIKYYLILLCFNSSIMALVVYTVRCLSPITTPGTKMIWWAMDDPTHNSPRFRYDFLYKQETENPSTSIFTANSSSGK